MSLALRSLSDRDLLDNTQSLVARERGITIEVLSHLNEVERRRLHLELGYSSMFAYCTEGLGYSAGAAKRRISTARCIAEFPDALPLLVANEINLSTIAQVARLMKPHNGLEILERIRRKSQREVESIAAEYDALETLPKDRVRTVVIQVPIEPAVSNRVPATAQAAEHAVALSTPQVRSGPEPAPPAPAMRFERRTVVQFSAREDVLTKLEQVRALASHRLPSNAPLEQVIEFLADYFTRREDPKARHLRRKTGMSSKPAETPKTSSARAIPARVRDEVFVRDGGQCCFVGTDGNRCGSRQVLQIDHIKPVARGGAATVDNLRLLCAYHNRLEAEKLMGSAGPPGRGH